MTETFEKADVIKHNFELFDWAKKNAGGDDIVVVFDAGSASMEVDPSQIPETPTIDEDRARFLLSSYYDDETGWFVPTWRGERDPGNLEKMQAVLFFGEIFEIGVWVPLTQEDKEALEYFLQHKNAEFNFDDPEQVAAWERYYQKTDWTRYDRGQYLHYRLNDVGDKYLEKRE